MLVGTATWVGFAQAQGWPGRPITLIAPHPPGGGVDTVARTATETAKWDVQVSPCRWVTQTSSTWPGSMPKCASACGMRPALGPSVSINSFLADGGDTRDATPRLSDTVQVTAVTGPLTITLQFCTSP